MSIPYSIGMLQGAVLERLPDNMFTVTRDQVCLEPSTLVITAYASADASTTAR